MEGSTTTLEAEDGSAAFLIPETPAGGVMALSGAPAVNGYQSPDSSFSVSQVGLINTLLSQGGATLGNVYSPEGICVLQVNGDCDGVKLTEQQNLNIDANRLSATLSLFDPLMAGETSTDPEPRPSAPSGNSQINHSKSSAFVQQSFNGARPKTTVGMPRISLPTDSLDVFANMVKPSDNNAGTELS